MKIKAGPGITFGLFSGASSGVAAYAFLSSCRPVPESLLSGLLFTLFGGLWLAIFAWSVKQVVVWRTVMVTAEGVREHVFLLGLRLRRQEVRFSERHFVDWQDYRAGLPVERSRTWFFFAGRRARISISVEASRADEIKSLLRGDVAVVEN